MKKRLKRLCKEQKGMFTLEASLVFPMIFIITIALVLYSLVIFQQVQMHQQAHLVADRIAASYDNTAKDIATGEFSIKEYTTMTDDGLYWRTNRIGESFLSFFVSSYESGLSAKKRVSGQEYAESRIKNADVEVVIESNIVNPQIEVTITSDLKVPSVVLNLFGEPNNSVTAVAKTKDPTELIRLTDFAMDYGQQILNQFGGE
ncbi:Flp pilus assembly protein TadG [Natronobacillus azotifigens]|uniref:Pilus assembly protein n=1 Tax=Natronobacillus azotifigens TaxID=472978 RepID=A0A9J6RC66_9BACI|nr:hypothetical protein [Natronobacillus azotifigens]MCZ0703135.1 hypothetical protein [Natronobacillus azotifigens]